MLEGEAYLAVSDGRWDANDLIAAVTAGNIRFAERRPPSGDRDEQQIEVEAEPPPFYALRLTGRLTPRQFSALTEAVNKARS